MSYSPAGSNMPTVRSLCHSGLKNAGAFKQRAAPARCSKKSTLVDIKIYSWLNLVSVNSASLNQAGDDALLGICPCLK